MQRSLGCSLKFHPSPRFSVHCGSVACYTAARPLIGSPMTFVDCLIACDHIAKHCARVPESPARLSDWKGPLDLEEGAERSWLPRAPAAPQPCSVRHITQI